MEINFLVKPTESSAELLEISAEPDLLPLVQLDLGDVAEGSRCAPAAREPASDAAPGVTPLVLRAARDRVEPGLVAVVAGPPDAVRGVGVHRGGGGDGWPAAVLVGEAILQDPVAL